MGLLEKLRSLPRQMAGHAEILKSHATERLKQKAGEMREAIGPQKLEPVKEPERPFGREGAEDVKQVVWTGHTVESQQGRRYYGAVGLTQQGYYRAAEVQVYGAEERWRWQTGRHSIKADAIGHAEKMSALRLKPERETKPAKERTPHPHVINPDYFPNVWCGKAAGTPSGTLVGVVNMDRSDHQFYAGVHHFPNSPEGETVVRWVHQPHATKEQAIARAETFVRRGVRSMKYRAQQMKAQFKEWKEDAALGRQPQGRSKETSGALKFERREGPMIQR